MQDYRKLLVWNKAHNFALRIYKVTSCFPKEETYSLVSQLRRAVVSIPSNIAEGCGRNGNKELKQFISISLGSSNEVEYQLLLAYDLGYITPSEYEKLKDEILEIRKMLIGFINKLCVNLKTNNC